MDPHEDKYQGWTPYNYAFDNPIIISDPSGKDGEVSYKEGKGTKKDPNVITIKANYYYNKNTLSQEQVDALNSTISDYNGTETTVKDKDGKYTVIKYDLSAKGLDNDEAVENAATGDTFKNSKGGDSRFGNIITAGDGPKTSESEGNGPPFGKDESGKKITLYNNNIEDARKAGYNVKTILENTLNHEIGHNLGGEHGDPSPMNFHMNLSDLPNFGCLGCQATEKNVPFERISLKLAPTLLDRINNFVGKKYIKYRADAQPPNP
jgi:hypothetical protein